jgi:hypothetical protein
MLVLCKQGSKEVAIIALKAKKMLHMKKILSDISHNNTELLKIHFT